LQAAVSSADENIRFADFAFLVRLYLKLNLKPLGKQMSFGLRLKDKPLMP
jgi:hypothetical protein